MTLYAVYDPQGKMCSEPRSTVNLAWQDFRDNPVSHPRCTLFLGEFIHTMEANGYRIAEVGIYNQETQVVSEWISIDDHWPSIGQKVILFGNGVVQEDIYMFDAGDCSDYGQCDYFFCRDDLDESISIQSGQFWMALPKPPKQFLSAGDKT